MAILGKDLLYSRMNPFELTAMYSDGKIIIGNKIFPIGEMSVRLLNYDAAEVLSAVDESSTPADRTICFSQRKSL